MTLTQESKAAVSIRMPVAIYQRIKDVANSTGASVNSTILLLIHYGLPKIEQKGSA